jgi:KUP system potassium uptake protein
MVITSVLSFFVALRFRWSLLTAAATMLPFFLIDLAFFGANLVKIEDGGWYPVATAVAAFVIMTTWARGRLLLAQNWGAKAQPLSVLVDVVEREPFLRIPGTAVLLTPTEQVPPHFFRHLERHRVLQRQVIVLTVLIEDEPRVPASRRLQVYGVAPGILRMIARYGFMQSPDIPAALRLSEKQGLDIDLQGITYYVGRETLIPTEEVKGMALWREHLFAFLSRNAMRATLYYDLPVEDVVELGFQVEI